MANKPPAPKPVPRKSAALEAEPLPLDDLTHWMPLDAAHKLLAERIGNPSLAAADLTSEAEGRANCIACRRRLADGVCKLTLLGYWDDHALSLEVGPYGLHGLQVIPPRRPGGIAAEVIPSRSIIDRVFFVWGPDVDKLWPTLRAHVREPEPEINRAVRKSAAPQTRKAGSL